VQPLLSLVLVRGAAMSSTLIATRAGDKGSLQAQLEHLQMKFVGTGHPDISK
jgi:hypothetical protein